MKAPEELKKGESHNVDNILEIKRGRGRPVKFNDEELDSIYKAFNEYIESVDDPTIVGFISSYRINDKYIDKSYLQTKSLFTELIKQARYKEEQYLLKQFKNPTMAIFRLKQPLFGYSDKTEIETRNLHVVVPDMSLSKDFTVFLKKKTTISTSKPKDT